MKAIGYQASLPISHADALQDIEIEKPQPTGRDLLVEIKAISVNPVDCKVRMRAAPAPGEYKVLGWDAVGIVQAVGEQVSLFKPGDAVWYAGDITRQGSNAEFQLVDERLVGHKPASISDAEAAALPLTSITAWELLFERLQLKSPAHKGSKVLLIVGAAGGVGSIMTQLAAQLPDIVVIGTASRPESRDWVLALGADYVIDHRQPLSEELARIGIKDVTHVASLTHTEQHFTELVKVLRPQGKLALIDDPAEPLDIMLLKGKSISLHWESMFTRSLFTTDDMIEQHSILDEVSRMIDAGTLKTTLGKHFGRISAQNLRIAHQHVESNTSVGKAVLEFF
jgi:zinc-binding alcohol dehydrogenase family protein